MATAPSPRAAAPILPTKVITSSENSQLEISRSREKKKKESKGKGKKRSQSGLKGTEPPRPPTRQENERSFFFLQCSRRFCSWLTAPESPGCWRSPRDVGWKRKAAHAPGSSDRSLSG